MGHLFRGLERIEEIGNDLFRSCQAPDRGIFDQAVLERIPGVCPLIGRTDEVIADTVRVRMVEARHVRDQIITFSLKTR